MVVLEGRPGLRFGRVVERDACVAFISTQLSRDIVLRERKTY